MNNPQLVPPAPPPSELDQYAMGILANEDALGCIPIQDETVLLRKSLQATIDRLVTIATARFGSKMMADAVEAQRNKLNRKHIMNTLLEPGDIKLLPEPKADKAPE